MDIRYTSLILECSERAVTTKIADTNEVKQCEFGSPEEAAKIAHEYAWRWFAYHAQQRLTLFSFSLIALGALAAGCASALSQKWHFTAAAAAVSAAFLAVVFFRLDQRNSELTKLAEEYLKHHTESALAPVVGPRIRLARLADQPKKNTFYTFGQVVRVTYSLCVAVAICVVFFAVHSAWPHTICAILRCCTVQTGL
jgi:hypothetical protein